MKAQRGWLRRGCGVLAGIALLAAFAPPALAADLIEPQPSQAQIAQSQATVAGLQAQLKHQAADVSNAQQALQAAAELAGQALEASSIAVRTLATRQEAQEQAQTVLDAARAQATARHQQLGQWASQAYQGGSDLALDPTLNALLGGDDLQSFSTNLEALSRIGRMRAAAARAADATAARANAAQDVAASATQQAADAAVKLTTDQQAADAAVQTQSQLLGLAQTQAGATQDKISAELKRQDELQAAATMAAGTGVGSAAKAKDNRVTGKTGSCTSAGIQQYADGQIPLSALCALQTAPGQYLRADAAYAFDRLSYDYQQQFGTPICVTDSYRSYAEQVRLYATKPDLAAMPGTSNHGWGTAVDLCGGIESFSTSQHSWMLLNAPLYGWFHPSWAEPTGSRPEPWHWEYGGS